MYESTQMDERTHWWHCPYAGCGKWSLVQQGCEVHHHRDGTWSVQCPACRRSDQYVLQRDLDLYLPGLTVKLSTRGA